MLVAVGCGGALGYWRHRRTGSHWRRHSGRRCRSGRVGMAVGAKGRPIGVPDIGAGVAAVAEYAATEGTRRGARGREVAAEATSLQRRRCQRCDDPDGHGDQSGYDDGCPAASASARVSCKSGLISHSWITSFTLMPMAEAAAYLGKSRLETCTIVLASRRMIVDRVKCGGARSAMPSPAVVEAWGCQTPSLGQRWEVSAGCDPALLFAGRMRLWSANRSRPASGCSPD